MRHRDISFSSDLIKWIADLGLPWIEIASGVLKLGRKLFRGLAQEGIYEVLEYETTVEILDSKGEKASLIKREKVRYLQNHIIAYQDQAWGDGRILIGYRCSPGSPVDRYQSGYKTLILISLRKVKNKGDVDEFQIQWRMQRSFLLPSGFWETDISHRTQQIKVQVVFPENRPPVRAWIVERNLQRTRALAKDTFSRLPNGKWLLSWEQTKPRLYEHYILHWEW